MIYNRFGINTTIRVCLITLSSLLLLWTFKQEHLYVARFTILLFILAQNFALIHYVNKSNRQLSNFLSRLKHSDTISSIKKENTAFGNLETIYHDVSKLISSAKIEKESEHHFLLKTIEHVDIGLLAYNHEGKFIFANNKAKFYLQKDNLCNLHQIKNTNSDLYQLLLKSDTDTSQLFQYLIDGRLIKLTIKRSEIKIREEKISIVSLHDIRSELESGELDAWQKLIRVLTHEIMNSISPIKTLTNTLIKYFEKEGKQVDSKTIDNETITDILLGLHAIDKRNKGLLNFVQLYKNLTRIPKPVLEKVRVKELFTSIDTLMKNTFRNRNINFIIDMDTLQNPEIIADEKLISQVIINLISNSINALESIHNGIIELKHNTHNRRNRIQLIDNGTGIPDDVIDKIFIPFYTTNINGSGIGLSLSRQIMKLHNGSLFVDSIPNEKTVFTLEF